MGRKSFFHNESGLNLGAVLAVLMALCSAQAQPTAVIRVPVVISGGHETDPRDHGRPVVLVAGGLGVAPEVFREAFSRVQPVAPGNYPDQVRAQQNKSLLLSALGKYGITNEKLDLVSDYYRYQPGTTHLWPATAAVITALVENGKVTSFEITDGGSGYSSQPLISVPGAKVGSVSAHLYYGQDLKKNGSIGSVTLSR
jgi:hypothetical protein